MIRRVDERRARNWKPPTSENIEISTDGLFSERSVHRKALSDIVEALLGASWVTGGASSALRTGTVLGLCFGGVNEWHMRDYPKPPMPDIPRSPTELETILGYQFRSPCLLQQALSHRSYTVSARSYEREEFLGDGEIRSAAQSSPVTR